MKILKMILDEDKFDDGIKSPAEYPYLKRLRSNLMMLNAWPDKEIGEKVGKYRVLVTCGNLFLKSFYFVAGGFYMKMNIGTLSFYQMGHTYVMMLLTLVALTRIFMISLSQKCRNLVATFLTKIHLFYFKDLSEHAMTTHKRIHFISHVFTLWLIFQWWIGIIFFNLIPMYRNYSLGKYKERNLHNRTYEHSIYLQFPFDTSTQFYGYLFAYMLNLLDTYVCTAWFLMVDLLLSLIIFHLWGHYKILILELGSFPLPAKKEHVAVNDKNEKANSEMYSEDELNEVSAKLNNCIDYHRLIADFTNKISDSFGPMLFIYYAFHQATGCLLLLECSQMTAPALICYGPLTLILFQQLIQLSVIFELLGSTSEKLKDAVYGVPWECMDVKNRKTVAIFLINVQEPVHVNALGLARVGVTSMAAIIKTSLTYFTFLRSL